MQLEQDKGETTLTLWDAFDTEGDVTHSGEVVKNRVTEAIDGE